jgi:hypothetical protein
MHDFDTARKQRAARDAKTAASRTFQIGGEKFTWAPSARPEALTVLTTIRPGKRDNTGAYILDADDEPVDRGTPLHESVAIIDSIITDLIEDKDNAHERWASLRTRTNDPITLEDMQELVQWLISQVANRTPTQPSSQSTRGRTPTATTSKVA